MPLTPSATRELLASLGHNPKRFLGQNFLVDGNIVRKSLELAQIAPADTVVEIGPGLGTLTNALLETGAHVYAVEKDTTLHAHLASTLAPKHPQTFHLIHGDALDHPLAGLDSALQPFSHSAPSIKVVANLPYAISTPWMDAILSGPLPERMVLMLQQEAAQRYTAGPGTKQYSAISIFLQNAYDIAPGHKVSAACFYPRPDIESYLLHLVRKPRPFIFATETKAAIRACFQQRRKQLGALLRDRLPDGARGDWFDYLATAGQFTPKSRPEEIPPELWTHFPANPPPQTRA
ncbi:16S rRNA (adenine1518-N6/adenine1519-N6)-dimethyltransferase [Ereboglobus sp. PH5-5]|uniref:16S rRNA (adenine(1518)-N(6)/adenine(1519)-N(6))- dimethyltransferase RsmA n=1 Tax=Ereboglobus sp. PH5-5 TaxID=2940529 RepID=UPI00240669D0|nr:16S rRNA (adenine(1518)-N(6)/adenine(1519)-N(6))-dimethyltransferase RsmA [Ereboglobus sp. PH5-5]MDF9832068.1 16S rRNA (adenine1518-N6/adenine1519-N6)-dimethyltransferase [Ereboglobus sp. PH5-5]